MDFDDGIPIKHVSIRPRLERYAKKNGLVIDWYETKKIVWMELHGGICFCDRHSDRRCPCSRVKEDLKKYRGSCSCGVLKTPEKLREAQKQRRRKEAHTKLPGGMMLTPLLHVYDPAERAAEKRRREEKAANKQIEDYAFWKKLEEKQKKIKKSK
jgi:hypothetical protein